VNRAKTYDEIKPLIDMCKAGKVFEVQDWIAAGKPINPPPPEKGVRRKRPLEVAIDRGIHSLVQVLLEAGADVDDPGYNALEHALFKRRLDLIKLLVNHGADIHSVEMILVFESWDPKIIEYFIEQGADVETESPLATALCWKIRTALGVFKRHKHQYPSFQEQLNIALRHHCKEGNLKWVSLMLWAGADPYAKGLDSPGEEPDPEEDISALEYAALGGHLDIFKLKQFRLDPKHPIANDLLQYACWPGKADILKLLIEKGFSPKDCPNSGTSLIQSCLINMTWSVDFFYRNKKSDLDSTRSREKIKMIHMLAKSGAKWMPEDRYVINDARRELLKMKPDFTIEFIWIMTKYNASTRKNLEQLFRTPTIRALVAAHLPKIQKMIASMRPDESNAKSPAD
jgi:hypothetical protein